MIIRRLHFGNQPASGGGGGGPTPALVNWGPDFGTPPENDLMAMVDLDVVKIENSKSVGDRVEIVHIIIENDKTVGASHNLESAKVENSESIGTSHDLEMVQVENSKSLAASASFSHAVVVNDKSIGNHLSGSVVGAPFFQGIGITTQTANNTSVTLTPDQTAVDGDFLIVNIGQGGDSAGSPTVPSGWTLLRSTLGGGALIPRLVTYYRLAGVSEPASYTWTTMGQTAHVATIIRLTGVHATTPINAEDGSSGSATDPVSPSITTTVANCFMISVCAQANQLTQTYTPPAGYVERADHAGSALGVVQVTSETATRVQAAAGASGTKTHNSNQVIASQYVCHHIAVAPGELIIAS